MHKVGVKVHFIVYSGPQNLPAENNFHKGFLLYFSMQPPSLGKGFKADIFKFNEDIS